MAEDRQVQYEVYLLQTKDDVPWVEKEIAIRLRLKEKMNPFLFKWESIAGESRQQRMRDGFDDSQCCAMFLGEKGLAGWDEMLQEVALNRKASQTNSKYSVIPVLLPAGDPTSIPPLLADTDFIDFRDGQDFDEQFYRLVCAIKGNKPGPWTAETKKDDSSPTADQLRQQQYLSMIEMIHKAQKKGILTEPQATAQMSIVLESLIPLFTQNTSTDPVNVQRVN